jgi:hypothetical protein
VRPRVLSLLGALLVSAALLAPPAQAALQIGISEQNANMFASRWFKPLGVRHARIVVPWNILERRDYWPGYLRAWLAGAERMGVTPHVAFGIADITPRQFGKGPTLPQYRSLIRGFRRAYPKVRSFTPWNEANHHFQPTARRPRLAWRYHRALKDICPRCTVLAADVADNPNLLGWLRAFLRHHRGRAIWGLHNYQDANKRLPLAQSWTLRMTRMVRGSIWSTEAGGLVGFKSLESGAGYRYDVRRQLRAQRHLFGLMRHPKVRHRYPRAYVYNWFGTWSRKRAKGRWDSGLVGPDGRPRPVYWDLRRRLQRGADRHLERQFAQAAGAPAASVARRAAP